MEREDQSCRRVTNFDLPAPRSRSRRKQKIGESACLADIVETETCAAMEIGDQGTPEAVGNRKVMHDGAKRIFLVDDHPLVREWLGALVDQAADLSVCGEASSVSEALQGLARLRPDVAIVDISLPDGSGFEVVRHIRAHWPETAVVVLSMHEERTYAERAIREGARGYVMKGENTGAIISAIRKVTEGGIFLSPSMKIANARNFLDDALSSPRSPVEKLSNREMEVFQLLGHTRGTRQIAQALNISIKTVQSFCERIKEKLQLANASELLREAVRWVDSQDQRNGECL